MSQRCMLPVFKGLSRLIFVLICILLICIGFSRVASANEKQFDAKHIKAAYLLNFIKNIQWPNEATKETYNLAIYKDIQFHQFLSKALSQKQIKNGTLVIHYVDTVEKAKQADMVYLSEKFTDKVHNIASGIRGSHTLLVTDGSDKKHDVMINLIQNDESGAISFEVNKSNILYEKLNMTANLLLIGGTELDIATLYRETEVAMQKTKQQSMALKDNLQNQQQVLKEQQQRLDASAKQLKKNKEKLARLNKEQILSVMEATKQKNALAQLKTSVYEKQLLLAEQKNRFENILLESKKNEMKLSQQHRILAAEELKNKNILTTVNKNKQVLSIQNEELEKHREQLKQQNNELSDKQQTISNQRSYILVTTILIIITVFASLLLIFFFIKNKKNTNKLAKTLTNLNDAQEQLVQAEKMASLGRLVAGVAHEINTPLSIAITANSLVMDDTVEITNKIAAAKLSKGRMTRYIETSLKSLSMSEKALERVKGLLTNFKLVAADQIVIDKREINLATYIDEVMSTLSVEMKNHHVEYEFSGEMEVLITTLPGVFAQVLTNLVMNSIVHGFDKLDSGDITINLATNNQNDAIVTYSDNGKGMDHHVLENIFEPFFTTKRGKGSTGLGMNIVYNIINQQLKGNITVNSEQDAGTVITITLPITIEH